METQTAMLLTQQEWDDLEEMVSHYRLCTRWAAEPLLPATQEHYGFVQLAPIRRRRDLALRIIDANA